MQGSNPGRVVDDPEFIFVSALSYSVKMPRSCLHLGNKHVLSHPIHSSSSYRLMPHTLCYRSCHQTKRLINKPTSHVSNSVLSVLRHLNPTQSSQTPANKIHLRSAQYSLRFQFSTILELECIYRLTQLSGEYIYYLLHRLQLHVSALFIGHHQVDKWET